MILKNSATPDVSVITVVHCEGRLTHNSAKSARRAARYAQARGVSVELIAVLDCPTQETLTYFEGWGKLFGTVTTVGVGDSGLARNHGVRVASGRYIAFLNPGDLFSENWLAAAFRLASEDGGDRLVLHPELNLFFGGEEVYVAESLDSDAPGYSPLELIEFNPWTSSSFVARSFFLDGNLYAAVKGSGFGRQHWHWDCEAIANRAVHRLVPSTVHFVRLSPQHEGQLRGTFRPSRLFDSPALKDLAQRPPRVSDAEGSGMNPRASTPRVNGGAPGTYLARARKKVSTPVSFLMRQARNGALGLLRPRPDLLQLSLEVNRALKEFRGARAPSPGRVLLSEYEWLAREWARIHEVEPELFPSRDVVTKLRRHAAPRSNVARRYPELSELVGGSPTHIYLMPWMRGGGVDVEAVHFMTATLDEEPGSRLTLITTENESSEWLGKLPGEVRAVEFGRTFAAFSEEERATLLLRLLLQKRPRVIHNLNSPLGFKLFIKNGRALAAESKLFVSIFGVDFLPEGNIGGLAVRDLPRCIDHLSGVMTDSRYFTDRLCDMHGFDQAKFSVVYVPAPEGVERQRAYSGQGVLSVLWASRIDTEKRLDVLYRVASELVGGPFHFHVHGGEVLRTANYDIINALSRLPNVTVHGPYDGFASLPVNEYDVFLYTSERDGMPNVLLEAAACGLPVIAPDVGGVKEFINDSTGFLVSGPEAVDDYVRYLKEIEHDYQIVYPRTAAAKRLIESRHSWESFVRRLEHLPGYLHGGRCGGGA